MNKKEFLTELRSKLQGLPKDDLDNRISFYDEMIEDRKDEGKSEEDAVAEIGSVDDVVKQIAQETPLVKLVKERTKPKRALRAWEIVLIILGFPLWFPLLLTAFILMLVGYLLVWILVIVSYVLEGSLMAGAGGGLVIFLAYLFNGDVNLISLGFAMASLGAAILLIFGCIGATKVSIKLSDCSVLSIDKEHTCLKPSLLMYINCPYCS